MGISQETLYGVYPVLEALEAQNRRIGRVWVDRHRRAPGIQRIIRLATARDIPVETVTSSQLRHMLGHAHHQGVAALASPLMYQPFEATMSRLTEGQGRQTLVVLDGVTDVGNFAALLRSAAAFGVAALFLPRHRSVSLTPTVAKRSAGALERLAMVQVSNVAHTLAMCKQAGFWVFGADSSAGTSVSQVAWPERVVLVLGSEDRGMRRLVREHCDDLVRIPMQIGADSLNVAVAGAIILAYIWDSHREVKPSLER